MRKGHSRHRSMPSFARKVPQNAKDLSRTADTVIVLETEMLRPMDNPEQALSACKEAMTHTSDWEKLYHCVENIRRIAVHSPSSLLSDVRKIMSFLQLQAKGLRSAAVKNALFALREVISAHGRRAIAFDCRTLMRSLIVLATCDKGFIKKAAMGALDSISGSASCEHALIHVLSCVVKPNAKMVSCGALYARKIATSMSAKELKSMRKMTTIFEHLLRIKGNARLADARKHTDATIAIIAGAHGTQAFGAFVKKNFFGRHALTLLQCANR